MNEKKIQNASSPRLRERERKERERKRKRESKTRATQLLLLLLLLLSCCVLEVLLFFLYLFPSRCFVSLSHEL